ncbi:MAG: hypothetical protein M5R42_12925 [Rhodocyclaceae bacterium]|nr:hypothetical protein [Rhodocyclaceae bacterium]
MAQLERRDGCGTGLVDAQRDRVGQFPAPAPRQRRFGDAEYPEPRGKRGAQQLGRASAILGASRSHDATGGELRQHWYQVEAGRALNQRSGIALYIRAMSSFQERSAIAYRDKTAGVRLSYAF